MRRDVLHNDTTGSDNASFPDGHALEDNHSCPEKSVITDSDGGRRDVLFIGRVIPPRYRIKAVGVMVHYNAVSAYIDILPYGDRLSRPDARGTDSAVIPYEDLPFTLCRDGRGDVPRYPVPAVSSRDVDSFTENDLPSGVVPDVYLSFETGSFPDGSALEGELETVPDHSEGKPPFPGKPDDAPYKRNACHKNQSSVSVSSSGSSPPARFLASSRESRWFMSMKK